MENVKMCSFSRDGRYCTVRTEKSVRIYDMSGAEENPVIRFNILNASSVLYDGNTIYLTLDDENVIFCSTKQGLKEVKEFKDTVKLVSFVKGTKDMIIDCGGILYLYDIEKSKILYELPLQQSFKDYAFSEIRKQAVLIGLKMMDVSVYEDDDDTEFIDMAICDYETGEIIDTLGVTSIEDGFDDTVSHWPGEGNICKWPLLNYNNHIPKLIVCADNGKYLLCSVEGHYYFIVDTFTGELKKIVGYMPFLNTVKAFYVDDELEMIEMVLSDRIQVFSMMEIPKKELDELNGLYPALKRWGGDKNIHNKYEEKFSKIRYKYGDIELIREFVLF